MAHSPRVVVIAGPNGAGKSTIASGLLAEMPGITEYINADQIAARIDANDPAAVQFAAGREMFERIRLHAQHEEDFAMETTLSPKGLAPVFRYMRRVSSYRVYLLFVSLSSPELALHRIAMRVRMGGHDVPEVVVRRRYEGGLRNFFRLYLPLLDEWKFFDNSRMGSPILIARGGLERPVEILYPDRWKELVQRYGQTPE